jgi:4-amino-4-deoxy-L-arabinose transferase-like glycosyltransferase
MNDASPTARRPYRCWTLDWSFWLLIFLTFGIGFFLNIQLPLLNWDEGAFASASWQMLNDGNYLTPQLFGEARFDKPIGIYYLQASALAWVDQPWAVRLPSLLAGFFWAVALALFARREFGVTAGKMALLFIPLSLGSSLITHAATADAWLNFLLTVSMLQLYRYWQQPKAVTAWWIFFSVALGVLIKGPIAIAIPGAVSLLFYMLTGPVGRWFKLLMFWPGWILGLLLVLPWYGLMYLEHGQAFIDGFLGRHHWERFTQPLENHRGDWWYYLVAVWFLVLPFSFWLFFSLWRLPTLFKEKGSLFLFLVLWFVLVFLLFTFTSTKLPHYLLYASVPLFLLLAATPPRSAFATLLAVLPVAITLALLLFVPAFLAKQLGAIENLQVFAQVHGLLQTFDKNYFWTIGAALAAILLLCWWPLPLWQKPLWAALLFIGIVYGQLLPKYAEVVEKPIADIGMRAVAAQKSVYLYRLQTPSLTLYQQHPVEKLPENLPIGAWVATSLGHRDAFPLAKILYQRHGVVLLALP